MSRRRRKDLFETTRRPRYSKRKRHSKMKLSKVDIASPHEDDFNIHHPLHLQPGLKGLFMWCAKLLPNSLNFAKSLFLPRHNLEARLHSTQSELMEAREELKGLSRKVDELEKQLQKISSQKALLPAPPVIPPPPPPPLPPPVVKGPPTWKRTTQAAAKQPSAKKEIHAKVPCISLDDILKVKLKAPSDLTTADKENKVPSKQPRITLSDITSVNLKTRYELTNSKTLLTTPKSALLSRTLRKTAIKRSPGGTPLVTRDRPLSTATGPTPEIERALRRKFRKPIEYISKYTITEFRCLELNWKPLRLPDLPVSSAVISGKPSSQVASY